jgi:hypothetical protein
MRCVGQLVSLVYYATLTTNKLRLTGTVSELQGTHDVSVSHHIELLVRSPGPRLALGLLCTYSILGKLFCQL